MMCSFGQARSRNNHPVEALEPRHHLAVLPAGYVDTLVASGLINPVSVDFAPDGRLFVTEQRGTVRVIKHGQLLPDPFVSLNVSAGGERGALGIALDPAFETNGYVYIFYTAKTPFAHNRISRFTAAGDVAAAGSEQVLFELDRLKDGSLIHNGGDLKFAADGSLFFAAGENGASGNAQSLNTTLGKLLRINADGTIPSDNPFYGQTTDNNRAIHALGFRNPFTFDIDRKTGRLFVNDVGEATWEEINEVAAGMNYGWPKVEGPGSANADPAYTPPLYSYRHGSRDQGLDNTAEPLGTSITGGTFYDPPADAPDAFPADLADDYFFTDGTNQWIWRLDPATQATQRFAGRIGPAVDVETGPDGSLYYVAWAQGEIRKITFQNLDTAPQIVRSPASQTVAQKQPVNFSVEAIGREPISYQWRRDGVNIEGATSATYSFVTLLGMNGSTFDVITTNELGSAQSAPATLTVIVDAPPIVNILTPQESSTYRGGQKIRFKGSATDPEDGKLSAKALSWEIVFHHDEHTHPFVSPFSGKTGGSLKIPRVGETSANVWYRIHLTAVDSAGVSTTVTRDVFPQKVTLTVDAPPGVVIDLDGQPQMAPFSFAAVVGITRILTAPPSQTINGIQYEFDRWKGRKSPGWQFNTPANDRKFVATFSSAPQA